MKRWIAPIALVLVLAAFPGGTPATADGPDVVGTWRGIGDSLTRPGLSTRLSLVVFEYAPGYSVFEWTLWRETSIQPYPGEAPGPSCDELPDLYTPGTAADCGELVQFDLVEGAGYVDHPANGETWGNQYRSWCRRDLRQLVAYATATVACKTADWDYWPLEPLGLGDVSEADGSIPGTSIGAPGHPPGTHTNGLDLDAGYYQLFANNNWMRAIGRHHDESYVDEYHMVAPPYALDVWRTALFLAYLAEHPRLRVVGVDGQAGLLLEDALDALVGLG